MSLHYNDVIMSTRRRFKSTASRLFIQSYIHAQINEDIKLRVTGHCKGNSPVTGEFPAHKGPGTRKMSPFGDVITSKTMYFSISASIIPQILSDHRFGFWL